MTMVVIGYDRFNVIVRGFKGQKITPGITFLILIAIWAYSVGVCIPPFFGWGGYALGKSYEKTIFNIPVMHIFVPILQRGYL